MDLGVRGPGSPRPRPDVHVYVEARLQGRTQTEAYQLAGGRGDRRGAHMWAKRHRAKIERVMSDALRKIEDELEETMRDGLDYARRCFRDGKDEAPAVLGHVAKLAAAMTTKKTESITHGVNVSVERQELDGGDLDHAIQHLIDARTGGEAGQRVNGLGDGTPPKPDDEAEAV